MSPVAILRNHNWCHWYEKVKELTFLTNTSAAFPRNPQNGIISLWTTWWSSELQIMAPTIHIPLSKTFLMALIEIILTYKAKAQHMMLHITANF